MARRNRPNPREERSLRRISSTRVVKQSFLIICEGGILNQTISMHSA